MVSDVCISIVFISKKKKILMPKWHIPVPCSLNMIVLSNTQGGDEMARANWKLCANWKVLYQGQA